MSSPAQVTVEGVSLGSAITGAGVWTGVLTVIGIIWRSRVPMRKLKVEADESLRTDLMARLEKVEANAAADRAHYEKRIEQERTAHAADTAIMRHRISNLDQCLMMLLALIEQDPEKAKDAAKRVREMRAAQEAAEAAEKGAIYAAKIKATTAPGVPIP